MSLIYQEKNNSSFKYIENNGQDEKQCGIIFHPSSFTSHLPFLPHRSIGLDQS